MDRYKLITVGPRQHFALKDNQTGEIIPGTLQELEDILDHNENLERIKKKRNRRRKLLTKE